MKNLSTIYLILLIFIISSCKPPQIEALFEDQEKLTIYDYIVENKDNFSTFLTILEKAKLDKTLSAYNPDGTNYTLFLPDNKAISDFVTSSGQFNSVNDMLNNTEFVSLFARYHVLNLGIHTNDFPFGAFAELILSKDIFTVSFIIEKDISYYKINNQVSIYKPNIKMSNDYIHLIKSSLSPVTKTTYK